MRNSIFYSYIIEKTPKKTIEIHKIYKRFYPKNVEPVKKLLNKALEPMSKNSLSILENTTQKAPGITSKVPKELPFNEEVEGAIDEIYNYNRTSASVVRPEPSILVYDPSRITYQLKNNFLYNKYAPLYHKEGLMMTFIKEHFPWSKEKEKGIPGSYTLSPDEKYKLLNGDKEIIIQHGYLLSRYLATLYGGEPIKNILDFIKRVDNIFTNDFDVKNICVNTNMTNNIHFIKGFYAKMQHIMAMDLYGLLMQKDTINYGKNINITNKKISVLEHSEIKCFSKSHSFLISDNNDEIRVINQNNLMDQKILKDNEPFIRAVVKQKNPDFIGQHILGCNNKVLYPIDVKRIGEPEINLSMLSSYSSESPEYFSTLAAQKMRGQISQQLGSHENVLLDKKRYQLEDLLTRKKKGILTESGFQEEFDYFCIEFFKDIINSNQILYKDKCYLPSFIAKTTMPEDNPYTNLQKTNPELLALMRKDAEKHFCFSKRYPTAEEYKTFDLYESDLEVMTYLRKYNMLDNYYTVRKLLYIKDIIGD